MMGCFPPIVESFNSRVADAAMIVVAKFPTVPQAGLLLHRYARSALPFATFISQRLGTTTQRAFVVLNLHSVLACASSIFSCFLLSMVTNFNHKEAQLLGQIFIGDAQTCVLGLSWGSWYAE